MSYHDRVGVVAGGGYAEQLARLGFVVLPGALGAERVAMERERLEDAIRGFPEFRNLSPHPLQDETPLVGGGFGALANASSFHCGWAREMRKVAQETVLRHHAIPVPPGHCLSQCFDRIMVRKIGQRATKEQWHRDSVGAGTTLAPGDALYGGWLALDAQTFSCVPGSQLAVNPGRGFAKLSQAEIEAFSRRRFTVQVPAGALLVFNETLVHEVVGGAHPDQPTQARLFTGWYVSPEERRIYERMAGVNFHAIIAEQAVPPLKSGQYPVMIPKMYPNQLRVNEAKIAGLVEILDPRATTQHTVGAGAKYRGGETITFPGGGSKGPMLSLASMESMLPAYSEEDLAVLTPQRDPYVDHDYA